MKNELDKLSIEELEKQLKKAKEIKTRIEHKGKQFCIVRTYSAGVFAGLYDRNNKGKEGTVYNAIRIHYWDGANSLSQMANEGVKKPDNCRFAQPVSEVDLKEIIEVLPCTDKAIKNIKGVKTWQQ